MLVAGLLIITRANYQDETTVRLINYNGLQIFTNLTIVLAMKNNIDSISVFFNKILKYFFIFMLTICACVPASAAVATATVTADITNTVFVSTINNLVFGDLSSGTQAGTLVLSSSGVRTTTGGVTVNTAVAGSSAAFDVQGTPNASYSVTFPAAVTMTNGSSNMKVDNLSYAPNTTNVIDASGQVTLFVGATLNVNSNQAYGNYSGQLSFTIDYN